MSYNVLTEIKNSGGSLAANRMKQKRLVNWEIGQQRERRAKGPTIENKA